ncbi:MarR family winged helix-turn-helix transcriptional regulator [Christensenella timonensis]|uniref:MarR family winged helix-turn-helix transcriptional regulator n=1 Tax=Christensenella timonensis TaxID=1816678 RepID=UPI0008352208|nr:MarR family winged helix-turn-helix transcriptional regulator [Christensenella timonensis]
MEHIEQIRREIDEYYENWFRINRAYDRWAQRHGTSDNTLFTLYTISACGDRGCTQRHICNEILLPKQTVSFILSKLEKQGLLRRREDPADRRNNLVFLTAEGKAYADRLLSALEDAEIRAYQRMNAAQRKALMDGYAALAAAIEQSFGTKE